MSTALAAAPRIAIVVVNYLATDLIATNLGLLAPTSPTNTPTDVQPQIVIVDNFSTEAERDAITSLCAHHGWTLLTPATNLGFGRGANAGIAMALAGGAEVVCLLNPDAHIRLETLNALCLRAAADPHGLRAPRVLTSQGRDWFTGAIVNQHSGWTENTRFITTAEDQHRVQTPGAWLTGACLVFHAQAWGLTGGFDPAYFLYWEDVDLSWRHVCAGGHLAYDGDLTVEHSVGGSQRDTGRSGRSPLYTYFNCRNRLRFAALHLGAPTCRRWLLLTPAYGRRVLLRGGRRQFLRPWSPITAALRGSAAGIRVVRALSIHPGE